MSERLYYHDGSIVRPVAKYWWESVPNGHMAGTASWAGTVTADTVAHTKGAWVEAIAATPADADRMFIYVVGISASATNTATLIDVGFGAAGTETTVISNIAVGGAYVTGGTALIPIEVPIYIPSGTRIAFRIQSVVAGGKTASVGVYLSASPNPTLAPTSVDSYGGTTSNSQGYAVTSANTWVQVSASTPRAYRAFALVPSLHSSNIAAANDVILSVGYGNAGSETTLGGILLYRTATEYVYRTIFRQHLVVGYVPAGSRLVIKDSVGGTGVGATLVGIP